MEATIHRRGRLAGIQSPVGALMGWPPNDDQNQGHRFGVVNRIDEVNCAVISCQERSLAWKVRSVEQKTIVSADVLVRLGAKIQALLEISRGPKLLRRAG